MTLPVSQSKEQGLRPVMQFVANTENVHVLPLAGGHLDNELKQQSVEMMVTIEKAWVESVRQAIAKATGESVSLLDAVSIPRSTQVHVRLGLSRWGAQIALGAILRAVPAAQIGRISAANHASHVEPKVINQSFKTTLMCYERGMK